MAHQFRPSHEPFQFESMETEWENGVNRKSPDYIKWVQQSLNQIMGLRLTVDGDARQQTRSAIRSFQGKHGLPVTGIVGPDTERAMIGARDGQPPKASTTKPDRPTANERSYSTFPSVEPESAAAAQPDSAASDAELRFESDENTLGDFPTEALQVAIKNGERDENQLTNKVFFSRHPERQRKKLVKGEPGFDRLAKEWLDIRDQVVRPALLVSETEALQIAIKNGERDENQLTNKVFFSRHPERQRRKLVKGEPGFDRLAKEWLDIRDQLVRPALSLGQVVPPPMPSAPIQPRPKHAGVSKSRHISARILWPALGFPAVIAPRDKPPDDGSDATHCICVLLLCDKRDLSKEEAASHLRYTSWDSRLFRAKQVGSFEEEELDWNRFSESVLKLSTREDKWSDGYSEGFSFGGNREGKNSITVHLSNYVRNFYHDQKLHFLYQIRVSEAASARLRDGQYHLFWENNVRTDNGPSEEMGLLLNTFADARVGELLRTVDLGDNNPDKYLMDEYRYEYGTLQSPYKDKPAHDPLWVPQRRYTEILHPLFVCRKLQSKDIKIGHITDIHVDVRADVYEANLKQAFDADSQTVLDARKAAYNNWNTSFRNVYTDAKRDSDVLLLTGDLIEYGRGHFGLSTPDRLGDDNLSPLKDYRLRDDTLYHVDRNWFYFYYLLATGDEYSRPVYTILGNHDWRLNPYPPFAPGATASKAFFHDQKKYSEEKLKKLHQLAHGPGHDRMLTYYLKNENELLKYMIDSGEVGKALWDHFIKNEQTLNRRHMPSQTTIDSVKWYLLSINPFLDYSFSMPGGHTVLMLDWAEAENLLFPIVEGGESHRYMIWQIITAADPGPKARNCLTDLQWRLVKRFTRDSGKAKVIGIHAPPIAPYADWYDNPDLSNEFKIYDPNERARGPRWLTRNKDGSQKVWNGHPLLAVDHSSLKGFSGAVADYGSFDSHRDDFIREVSVQHKGVRLVLAGHNHRNGLYIVNVHSNEKDANARKLLVKGLLPPAKEFSPTNVPLPSSYPYPLYLNTTSAGPRGHFKRIKLTKEQKAKREIDTTVDPGYSLVELSADGTVKRVEFRFPPITKPKSSRLALPRQKEGLKVR